MLKGQNAERPFFKIEIVLKDYKTIIVWLYDYD